MVKREVLPSAIFFYVCTTCKPLGLPVFAIYLCIFWEYSLYFSLSDLTLPMQNNKRASSDLKFSCPTVVIQNNPFMPEGLFHPHSLDETIDHLFYSFILFLILY